MARAHNHVSKKAWFSEYFLNVDKQYLVHRKNRFGWHYFHPKEVTLAPSPFISILGLAYSADNQNQPVPEGCVRTCACEWCVYAHVCTCVSGVCMCAHTRARVVFVCMHVSGACAHV